MGVGMLTPQPRVISQTGRSRFGRRREMAGWHHRFSGHELGQTPGDSKGQGGLVYCSPWGLKEWDTT